MWSCLAIGCFTVPGGCWCDILNVHENRFREELECVLSEFSKYHTTVLLRRFSAKVTSICRQNY